MTANGILRRAFADERTLLVPGAANALAARIIEDIGFEAVYLSGAGVANSYLGAPDIGLVSLKELAEHVAAVRDSIEVPLIVDADTGFGNAINVVRTVKTLERAGANAIQIEDQVFPKRCGHFEQKSLISESEMVQKIHAAVDCRHDEDLVIISRTDARSALGLDEALDRAAAYRQAGADVSFVESPLTGDEIRRIRKTLPGPQLINMVVGGKTPLMTFDEFQELGFAIVLYANVALQAAVHGMQEVLRHLHVHGSTDAVADRITSFNERQLLVRKPYFDEQEKKYDALEHGGSSAFAR